jgi:basic amino acid/polyamine antiporter, APA family
VAANVTVQPIVTRQTLTVRDAMGITVGIVIGAGIFEVPSLVAQNAGRSTQLIMVWVLGGLLSLMGALCIAELAAAYPNSGGVYFYLRRAFGAKIAFLYAWARFAVIQTGSIALLAFVFGDYASQIIPLGRYSSSIYAVVAILVFTALDAFHVKFGKRTQNLLTVATVVGLLIVVGTALSQTAAQPSAPAESHGSSLGLMLVFVLLTYGGWSEAAYISAELKDARRNIAIALIGSILFITTVYVLVNFALLHGLGMAGLAASKTPAAELLRLRFGAVGAVIVSSAVAFAALSSIHGTMFTGARTNYALGRDFPKLNFLGIWNEHGQTPRAAIIAQGMFALVLVLIGTLARNGFRSMVEYTAPVFWLFFLMAGIALFVLRRKDRNTELPFRVPLYPLTPALFCLTSAYLLHASLAYTGRGALIGMLVLLSGVVMLFFVAPKNVAEHEVVLGAKKVRRIA